MQSIILMFAVVSQSYSLPPGLLSALCYVESNHNVAAYAEHDGGSSSHGVCQIKLATARLVGFKGTEKDLSRPMINIHFAAKYLKSQMERYAGDIRKAVAAYNAGTFRENEDGLTKNRKYVSKVFKAWAENR